MSITLRLQSELVKFYQPSFFFSTYNKATPERGGFMLVSFGQLVILIVSRLNMFVELKLDLISTSYPAGILRLNVDAVHLLISFTGVRFHQNSVSIDNTFFKGWVFSQTLAVGDTPAVVVVMILTHRTFHEGNGSDFSPLLLLGQYVNVIN